MNKKADANFLNINKFFQLGLNNQIEVNVYFCGLHRDTRNVSAANREPRKHL